MSHKTSSKSVVTVISQWKDKYKKEFIVHRGNLRKRKKSSHAVGSGDFKWDTTKLLVYRISIGLGAEMGETQQGR